MDVLSRQATDDLFLELGGRHSPDRKLPMMHSTPMNTKDWGPTIPPVLDDCGVVLIGRTMTDLSGVKEFLEGYGPELNFGQYLEDTTKLTDGTQLAKFAGQLCYTSFSEKRSFNKDASRYMGHIKESGHGSVLEHPNYNFLMYGISRSNTHELVRHRAGTGFSQVSQRYVSGRVLRFVLRPEYVGDDYLLSKFMDRCATNFAEYHEVSDYLVKVQAEGGRAILSAEQKTDLRKKVQQVARSLLPNETEAPVVVSTNGRAIRHVIEMRSNGAAETEIRRAWFKAFLCIRQVDPELFEDYEAVRLEDGTFAVQTKYRKV